MTTIGVRGGLWCADVSATGDIHPSDGSTPLRWFIAGDDRWYEPGRETSLRQTILDGLPIIETRMRVPGGDAVVTAYATADQGGVTVVEVKNETSLPFAVALTRSDAVCGRKPATVPIAGIDLPQGSVIHPIGHGASLRFVLSHAGRSDADSGSVASASQVAAGWHRALESSTRLHIPDNDLVARMNHARCELLLTQTFGSADDVDYVLTLGELVRMGESLDDASGDFVTAVESIVKRVAKDNKMNWDQESALVLALHAFHLIGDHRAATDVRSNLQKLPAVSEATDIEMSSLSPARLAAFIDRMFVRINRNSGVDILPYLSQSPWLGTNFEVHGLVGGSGVVSFAVRWHGERPGLLWEVSDASLLPVTSMVNDSKWHSNDLAGEALLAPPEM